MNTLFLQINILNSGLVGSINNMVIDYFFPGIVLVGET